VLFDCLKCLANSSQHSQTQTINFENAQFIKVVFIPLNNRSIRHGRVFERNKFTQWSMRDDHSAGMLREMSGKSHECGGPFYEVSGGKRLRIKPRFTASFKEIGFLVEPLDCAGKAVHFFQRKAEGLPHIPDRRARTVGDDFGCHPGTFPSIFAVNILNDFFPSFVLKIHVDIGSFVAFPADKTFKEKVHPVRIHSSLSR